MSVEEQFQAAVRVIQNLPKEGSFQPSHAMMKRFYGLYKQSTVGPCAAQGTARPGFWDPINRAKFDAWSVLGDMGKEEAMRLYVEEIKKIIETMSYSTDVATLTSVLGPFYEYVTEEEAAKEARQRDEEEEQESVSDSGVDVDVGGVAPQAALEDASHDPLAEEGRAFMTEVLRVKEEIREVTQTMSTTRIAAHQPVVDRDNESSDEEEGEDVFEDPAGSPSELLARQQQLDVEGTLRRAVASLNRDLEQVSSRVAHLERTVFSHRSRADDAPAAGLSAGTWAVVLLWPFAAQALVKVAGSLRRQT